MKKKIQSFYYTVDGCGSLLPILFIRHERKGLHEYTEGTTTEYLYCTVVECSIEKRKERRYSC
jgi:hypothetical protein